MPLISYAGSIGEIYGTILVSCAAAIVNFTYLNGVPPQNVK